MSQGFTSYTVESNPPIEIVSIGVHARFVRRIEPKALSSCRVFGKGGV